MQLLGDLNILSFVRIRIGLAPILQWTETEKYVKCLTIILREKTKRATKYSCCNSVQTNIRKYTIEAWNDR